MAEELNMHFSSVFMREPGNLERRHQSKEVGERLTLALIHPGCLRYYGRM